MNKSYKFINKFIYPLGLFVMLSGFSYKVSAKEVVLNEEKTQITVADKTDIKVENKDDLKKEETVVKVQNTILKDIKMNFKYAPVYETRNIEFMINGNYGGYLNYRVLLHNKQSNDWRDITSGYTYDRNGNDLFKVNLFNVKPGEYELYVFAKTSASQGDNELNLGKYTVKYDDYKIEQFECKKNDMVSLKSSIKENKIYENSQEQISMQTSGYHGMMQYAVWIYSDNNKSWTNITEGYTDEMTSEENYKVTTDKLKAGNYKISVRVKKAWEDGSKKDNLGTYDDKKEFDLTVMRKYQPKVKVNGKIIPKADFVYVGNDDENNRIRVRKGPSTSTPTIAYIYGSTQGIKVLDKKDNFYNVQATDYDTCKVVNGYIRCDYVKKVVPDKTYSILVDLNDQRVYVYKNDKLVQKFICSTGTNANPTPRGTYLIGGRGASFGQEKGYICYNFVRINHNYLFHSVIHNLDGSIIQSEYNKLGSKASHGCIRLKDQDIKWIYNNIPRGTLVVIQ